MSTQKNISHFESDTKSPRQKREALRNAIGLLGTASEYSTVPADILTFGGQRHQEALPSIDGYPWEASPVEKGPGTVLEYWRQSTPSRWESSSENDPESVPGTAGYILSGADELVREHGTRSVEFPEAYTRFDSFGNTYRWSADGATHITPQYLEWTVRLANGPGRINHENTHVVLCDRPWIVTAGDRGIFWVKYPGDSTPRELDPLPDPPAHVHYDVLGLDVPEENPILREGFKRLLELRRESKYPNITEYEAFAGISHRVRIAQHGSTDITSGELSGLTTHDQQMSEIAGPHTYSVDGKRYRVDVEKADLPGEIGSVSTASDTTANSEHEKTTGIVAGYDNKWWEAESISLNSNGVRALHFAVDVALITASGDIVSVRTVEEKINVQ